VHVAPACVTVNACPPMVIVALRGDTLVFAGALNVVVPAPVPLAPPVIVSHAALLAAVHAQPVPAVIPTEPAPPLPARDALVADSP
jgi:hypothetical protein